MSAPPRRTAGPEEAPAELDALLEDCWRRLQSGVADAASPLHTPALATVHGGGASVRTVVLRRVDAALRRLACHTDTRSPKVAQVGTHPRVAWLFYDAASRVQIRAEGALAVHRDDALADAQWHASRLLSRRCYLGDAPGAPSAVPTSGLDADLATRAPREDESEAGRAHFAVLACTVDRLDRLDLDVRGHRRAQWRFDGGAWHATWVAP